MQIGAQFFTIREYCKTLPDFAESLKKVADIGYRTVQISGTCPYEPQWLKEQLDLNGLKCVITHTNTERLVEETEAVAKDHDIFDCKYVGLGAYSFNPEMGHSFEDFMETYVPVAQRLKECGKYFMYHNHAHEFKRLDGKLIFDKITQSVPADILGFTLDTYWVQVGGGDPAQWLEKLAGRIPVIHLKDCAWGQQMAVVGEGNINFDRVFEKAEAGGTMYMMVEQDKCNGEDPFDCLKRSYQNLKAHGFE
ncbi:MAG: sugar phosphate isomerase/epimerase [Ruminococcaceae bacterium]|nr:sugar phosphate isomerase/epimerase [Oscillospiraceae bacterium]